MKGQQGDKCWDLDAIQEAAWNNAWRDNISHNIYVSKELDAELNVSKIYRMSHWAEQSCLYEPLKQYSAERQVNAYKKNLKDSWNASNHNLNYLPQVITCERPILCYKIGELVLQAVAKHRVNSAASCKVLPSGADLAASVSNQSYANPTFIAPPHCSDGKHPDAMIKQFRALLDITQDATHSLAISSGMHEFIKLKSCNETHISHNQLHAMERCIERGIKVPVKG